MHYKCLPECLNVAQQAAGLVLHGEACSSERTVVELKLSRSQSSCSIRPEMSVWAFLGHT